MQHARLYVAGPAESALACPGTRSQGPGLRSLGRLVLQVADSCHCTQLWRLLRLPHPAPQGVQPAVLPDSAERLDSFSVTLLDEILQWVEPERIYLEMTIFVFAVIYLKDLGYNCLDITVAVGWALNTISTSFK